VTVLRIWMRRSLALRLAPFVIGVLAYGAWSRPGWQYEWLWGTRATVAILALIAPLVAAAVAFDVVRQWEPLATAIGSNTRRWRGVSLALVGAHVIVMFSCFGLILMAAAVRLASNDAIGRLDPWVPIEVLAALAAAGGVGLVVGMHVRNLAAPPVAAVAVFVVESLALPFGLIALFMPTPLVSSAIGLTRDPRAAVMAIALNAAVAALCVVVAVRGAGATRNWTAALTVAVAGVVALVAVPASATPLEFRTKAGAQVCVREADVSVCGPRDARRFLSDLGIGLSQSLRQLEASGLPLARSYVLGLPGEQPPTDRPVAFASPARLKDHRREGTLVAILAQPRVCPQLLQPDRHTLPLLDRQEQVALWLQAALDSNAVVEAPSEIKGAYEDLRLCRPRQ
jgi:hypothetical protein